MGVKFKKKLEIKVSPDVLPVYSSLTPEEECRFLDALVHIENLDLGHVKQLGFTDGPHLKLCSIFNLVTVQLSPTCSALYFTLYCEMMEIDVAVVSDTSILITEIRTDNGFDDDPDSGGDGGEPNSPHPSDDPRNITQILENETILAPEYELSDILLLLSSFVPEFSQIKVQQAIISNKRNDSALNSAAGRLGTLISKIATFTAVEINDVVVKAYVSKIVVNEVVNPCVVISTTEGRSTGPKIYVLTEGNCSGIVDLLICSAIAGLSTDGGDNNVSILSSGCAPFCGNLEAPPMAIWNIAFNVGKEVRKARKSRPSTFSHEITLNVNSRKIISNYTDLVVSRIDEGETYNSAFNVVELLSNLKRFGRQVSMNSIFRLHSKDL